MKNKIIFLISAITLLLCLSKPVMAKENITVKTERNTDNVFITYSVEDSAIYGISTELKYDNANLELEKCEGKNNFTVTTNRSENLIIVAESTTSAKNTEIATCTFKIKNADSNVIVQNISASNNSTLQEQTQQQTIELSEIVNVDNTAQGANKIIILIGIIFVLSGTMIIAKYSNKTKQIPTIVLLLLLLIPIKGLAADAYTEESLSTARNIILKKTTYNETKHKDLDIDNDNKITINDLVKIKININTPIVTLTTTTTGTASYQTAAKTKVETESLTDIKEIKYCFGESTCTPTTTLNNPTKSAEISFKNNVKAQKICVKVTNKANLSKTTCSQSTYLVDGTKPSFDITSATVTTDDHTNYDTKSNVKNIKYGVSGGTISCTNATSVGTHTITCTATGNNGLKTEKTYTLKIEKVHKVLFIGNSRTGTGKHPKIALDFEGFAKAGGYKVEVERVTKGSTNLQEHLSDSYKNTKHSDSTIALVDAEDIDYLVIQEATDIYSENRTQFLDSTKELINLIKVKSPNVKVYIRATWVLATQDSSDNKWYFNDNKVAEAYANAEYVAAETGATVIYDGKAFKKSTQQYKNIILFSDERHQTREGAYLSAACVYKKIFNKSPKESTYKGSTNTGELSTEVATKLLQIAHDEG